MKAPSDSLEAEPIWGVFSPSRREEARGPFPAKKSIEKSVKLMYSSTLLVVAMAVMGNGSYKCTGCSKFFLTNTVAML